MALTPSEKLGALSTPRTDFIRELLKSHVSDDTLGGPSISWEMSRGADFRCVAQAVYCMEKWASDPDEVKNQGSLAQLEKWLAASQEVEEDMKIQVRETFDIFVRLVTTPKYSGPFHEYKKVSPAEIMCIALLIFVHGVLPPVHLQLTRRELSTSITKMRYSVRQDHADVRMNVRVGKTLVDFIKRIKEKEPESQKPTKSKRKRVYKDEEQVYKDEEQEDEEVEQQLRAVKLSPSRRKPPLTPAVSTSFPASLPGVGQETPASDMSAPRKKKKIVSLPTTSSPRKASSSSEAFRAHIPISPASSRNGTLSADRDAEMDRVAPSGPSATHYRGSNDTQMSDGTSTRF